MTDNHTHPHPEQAYDRAGAFWSAIGLSMNGPEDFSRWAEETVARGLFFNRQVNQKQTGAFVWDMGRSMQLWLYVDLPLDPEKMDPSNVEVTYALPAYRGDAATPLQECRLTEDRHSKGLWWVEAEIANAWGLPIHAPVVNFLEHAERITHAKGAKLVVSGLALSAQRTVERPDRAPLPDRISPEAFRALSPAQKNHLLDQVKEIVACPEQGSPTFIRGRIAFINPSANFHSGEALMRIGLDIMKARIELCGQRSVFPENLQPGETIDVFSFLQVFIP